MILQAGYFARGVIQLARKAALPLSLSFAIAGAWPATAQTEIPPPQPYPVKDANGVDLTTGAFSYELPSLNIGPADRGMSVKGSFEILYDAAGMSYTWRDSWAGMIVGQAIIGKRDLDPKFRLVTVMGQTIVFRKTGPVATTFVPAQGDNASLTLSGSIYTLTLADGTRAYFDKGLATRYPFVADEGLITSIVRPNGEVIAFVYEATDPVPSGLMLAPRRIMSITSSHGYQIKYSYVGDSSSDMPSWQRVASVKVINNAHESCAPLAHACALVGSWPSYTFSTSGNVFTVRDTLLRETQVTVASGGDVRIRKPTSTGNDDIVATGQIVGTGETQAFRTVSVTVGGNTWSYAYGPRPSVEPGDASYDYTVTTTDPLNRAKVFTFRSYPNGGLRVARIKQVEDALHHVKTYDYDASTYRLTSITEPEGNIASYQYDGRGNIQTLTNTPKPGSGQTAVAMSATYAASCSDTATDETNYKVCNKPKSVTDFRGATTDFTYDLAHGGVLTATLPPPQPGADRPQTRTAYSALYAYYYRNGGSSIMASDAPIYLPTSTSQCRTGASCSGTSGELLGEMVYSRSASGLPTNLQPDTVRRRAGDNSRLEAASFVYTAAGDVQDVTDALGRQWHSQFDAMRQKIGSVTPDPDGGGPLLPRAQYSIFDAEGRIISLKSGTVSTWNAAPATMTELKDEQTHYDALGRKDQSRLVVGGVIQALTEYSYDNANRQRCVALRMDKATYSASPVNGCSERTSSSYPAESRDRITYYTYDYADQISTVTSGYLVDPINERAASYTGNGKLLSETDGENNKTVYGYDGFDRLSRVTYPVTSKGSGAANSSDYDEYGYDNNGNRTSWRRRDGGMIVTTFDALNRPSTKTTTSTALTSSSSYTYAYDNLGNAVSVGDGIRTTSKSYDGLGRLTWEQDNALGAASRVSYEYDAAGRRTKLTWPDNFFVVYDYDDVDALTAIRRAGSSSVSDRIAGFTYDNLGRRLSVVRGDGSVTTSYAYNATDLRLQSLAHAPSSANDSVSFSFAYNVAGQITLRTISNPAYSWSSSAGSINRPYGIDGLNRIVDVGTSGQAGYNAYGYDGRGNLVCIAAAAPACTNPTVRYFYDVEARLRGTTAGASLTFDPLGRLFSSTTVGGTTTRYLYDGPNIIGEFNNSGTLLRRYVFGDGADEVLARYTGAGTAPEYLLADQQGSIIASTDSNGTVTGKATYDEYGAPGPGPNISLFQYTGQVYLSDLSLYHYKARAYSPTLGRFLQADPTGYDDGLNWYAYVNNDPLNATDPTGERSWREFWTDVSDKIVKGTNKFTSVVTSVAQLPGKVVAGEATRAGTAMTNLATGKGTNSDIKTLVEVGVEVGLAVATDGATEVEAVTVTASKVEAKSARSLIDRSIFASERRTIWRSEAANNADAYGAKDLARMKKGSPPIGPDGYPMELHHVDGTPEGGLVPMSRTDHRLGDNMKKNHPWLYGN